jgi:hypothetical protein
MMHHLKPLSAASEYSPLGQAGSSLKHLIRHKMFYSNKHSSLLFRDPRKKSFTPLTPTKLFSEKDKNKKCF